MAVCSEMIEGGVNDNPETFSWSVPYRYYMLTKVKMWKSGGATSGFEVTYTAPENFVGWEPIVQMFGTEGDASY